MADRWVEWLSVAADAFMPLLLPVAALLEGAMLVVFAPSLAGAMLVLLPLGGVEAFAAGLGWPLGPVMPAAGVRV